MFVLVAFVPMVFAGTHKAEAAVGYKYFNDIKDQFVTLQPKTKYYLWTSKQFIPDTDRILMAPLRADNFFYPKEGTSNMKVTFLPTDVPGVYNIQLPGNYFYVDESKPFVRYPDSAYTPEQRYYVLGQRPKPNHLSTKWQLIPVPGTTGGYRICNMATGRYLSVHIWDCSELGSPLRLICKEYSPHNSNVIQTFYLSR
ncbi:RICIN domain-containing protein [Enterococcus mundtii]|uniref:RICIN domain-containing protein n=1 Tax=Enterococcus mundtii TaxID=53346 RepID=UPI001C6377C2|nr:RICIN domain-containing protein [Enterococcus mundtii]